MNVCAACGSLWTGYHYCPNNPPRWYATSSTVTITIQPGPPVGLDVARATCEAAGLLVVADDEQLAQRIAGVIWRCTTDPDRDTANRTARAVISSALRSNPPADQPENNRD